MKLSTKFLLPAALLTASSVWAAPVPIDLNSWEKRGQPGNGNWVVAADGQSVLQTINGDPTYFVSSNNQINTTIRGKIRVTEVGGDDDYIGFVFGFNAPVATGDDMNYLLFDWKQNDQSSGGQLAREGFALSRVNGNISDYLPGHWGHVDNPAGGFDVLATDYGNTRGWADNVEYDFTILYQTGRIKIDIAGGAFGAGQTIFDVAGTFADGRFGFYNYSQQGVRYAGLTEQDTPPPSGNVPEPASLALAGLALLSIAASRRRRR